MFLCFVRALHGKAGFTCLDNVPRVADWTASSATTASQRVGWHSGIYSGKSTHRCSGRLLVDVEITFSEVCAGPTAAVQQSSGLAQDRSFKACAFDRLVPIPSSPGCCYGAYQFPNDLWSDTAVSSAARKDGRAPFQHLADRSRCGPRRCGRCSRPRGAAPSSRCNRTHSGAAPRWARNLRVCHAIDPPPRSGASFYERAKPGRIATCSPRHHRRHR